MAHIQKFGMGVVLASWAFCGFAGPATGSTPNYGRRLEAYEFRPGLLAVVGRNKAGSPQWINLQTAAIPGAGATAYPRDVDAQERDELIELMLPKRLRGKTPPHPVVCTVDCWNYYDEIFENASYSGVTTRDAGFSIYRYQIFNLTVQIQRLQRPWQDWQRLLGTPVEAYEVEPGLLALLRRNSQNQPETMILQGMTLPGTPSPSIISGPVYNLDQLPTNILDRLVPSQERGHTVMSETNSNRQTTCNPECGATYNYANVIIRYLRVTLVQKGANPSAGFWQGLPRIEISWIRRPQS